MHNTVIKRGDFYVIRHGDDFGGGDDDIVRRRKMMMATYRPGVHRRSPRRQRDSRGSPGQKSALPPFYLFAEVGGLAWQRKEGENFVSTVHND